MGARKKILSFFEATHPEKEQREPSVSKRCAATIEGETHGRTNPSWDRRLRRLAPRPQTRPLPPLTPSKSIVEKGGPLRAACVTHPFVLLARALCNSHKIERPLLCKLTSVIYAYTRARIIRAKKLQKKWKVNTYVCNQILPIWYNRR